MVWRRGSLRTQRAKRGARPAFFLDSRHHAEKQHDSNSLFGLVNRRSGPATAIRALKARSIW
jgi:hypothetical protein